MVRVAGCTLRSRARSHVTEDHPQPSSDSSVGSRRAAEGPHATPSSGTAARLPLLPPACESTPVTYCPRPLHSLRWEAPRKPWCLESDDGLLQSGMAVRRVPREAPVGVRERPPVLAPRPPPGKPSTIRCTPELIPPVGLSGTAWGSRGGFRSTRYCRNERL